MHAAYAQISQFWLSKWSFVCRNAESCCIDATMPDEGGSLEGELVDPTQRRRRSFWRAWKAWGPRKYKPVRLDLGEELVAYVDLTLSDSHSDCEILSPNYITLSRGQWRRRRAAIQFTQQLSMDHYIGNTNDHRMQ